MKGSSCLVAQNLIHRISARAETSFSTFGNFCHNEKLNLHSHPVHWIVSNDCNVSRNFQTFNVPANTQMTTFGRSTVLLRGCPKRRKIITFHNIESNCSHFFFWFVLSFGDLLCCVTRLVYRHTEANGEFGKVLISRLNLVSNESYTMKQCQSTQMIIITL